MLSEPLPPRISFRLGNELGSRKPASELLLEAALRHDVDSCLGEHVVARQLLRVAGDRSRLVGQRQEEVVGETQGEQLLDVTRARQALDAEHYLSTEPFSLVR